MRFEDILLQQVINGLSLGAMYSLLALGFTLVYGIIELINFAHFNVFMVGSFIAMWFLQSVGLHGQSVILTGLPLIGALSLAFGGTMLLCGLLGVVIERGALRPMRGVPGTAAMITTIGVSYILFNIILLTVGPQVQNYPNPLSGYAWHLGGAVLRLRVVLLWVVTLILMAVLHVFVRRTKIGKAMRATAQDQEAARMMGIDVDKIIVLAFFIGSALAGAAGLIFGLYYNFTSFIIGYTVGLRSFTAAVLGGIGNIGGAMLGGLIIGLIESIGGQLLAVQWTDLIIFSILIGVLVVRPSGLLGLSTSPAPPVAAAGAAAAPRPRVWAPLWAPLWAPVQRLPEVTRKRVGLALLVAAVLVFPVVIQNGGDIDAAANACAFAILALGLNIVVGFAGLLDLGYAAFFAIGAYTYGIVASGQISPLWNNAWQPLAWLGLVSRFHVAGVPDTVQLHFSFWLMLPGAALVAAFFGILFGAPTLRLKGDYLAIVTLGFGEIVPIVVRNTPTLTNGAAGLNGVISPQLFGYRFGVDPPPFYYLGVVMVAFLIFVSYRLKDSRIGRAWMAIREDEIAAGAMGVNRTRLKLLAFVVGAAFAGATGAYYIAKLETATPNMFMFPVSVMILVMVVLGGMGSPSGVVLGAVILQLLQSWFLQDLTQWVHALGRLVGSEWLQHVELAEAIELIFGIILVVMMLYRRQGLIPASRVTAPLSLTEQVAAPSRGGIDIALSGIRKAELPAATSMLETRGLTKQFGGITAVKDVALVIQPYTIVGLIGPNGSGKTTFFNLVTGLETPDRGQMFFRGEDVTGLPAHAIVERGIARTFQIPRLFNNMTVLENVLVGMHTRIRTSAVGAVVRPPSVRAEEAAAREWAMEVLQIFGNRLVPRVNHLASSLSYANRRRLEIARAIASRPALLLLDEPTAGMNPAETLELADQIRSLRDIGLTVLLIEHKLGVVNDITDKVAALDYGEKIAEGTAGEVQRNEDVIHAYLGRRAPSMWSMVASKGSDTDDSTRV